jgi:uncharacterized membrane protein HdeD (DUF308 family)
MDAELDSSVEIVLLLVLAIFMLLFGFLLFPIQTGALPYNADATYGLFQVIVSFQIIALGKTPFGDFRRSWLVVVIGICSAILGMTACFIPGSLTSVVRVSVGLVLLGGGLSLLVQLFANEGKAGTWMRMGGILSHLTVACTLVYGLAIALGAITLFPGIATGTLTASLLIVYGAGFAYLAWCIGNVRRTNPLASPPQRVVGVSASKGFGILGEAALPLSVALLLLLGVLLTLLGLLLFPVNLGLIAFSPDGQLGLLLTVMAIQIISLGDTPLGKFRRSPSITLVGLAFAALGIVSSIVPGLLTRALTVLLGVLNVAGAGVFFFKRYFPGLYGSHGATRVAAPANIEKTQTMLNWVALAFGISMLVPQLIPGLLIAGILVVNGLLLFRLASNLLKITGMQRSECGRRR